MVRSSPGWREWDVRMVGLQPDGDRLLMGGIPGTGEGVETGERDAELDLFSGES